MSNVTPSIDSSRISVVPSRSGFSVDTTSSYAKGRVVSGNSNEGRGVGRPVTLGSVIQNCEDSGALGETEEGRVKCVFQLRGALLDEKVDGALVTFGGDGGGECRNEDLVFERI